MNYDIQIVWNSVQADRNTYRIQYHLRPPDCPARRDNTLGGWCQQHTPNHGTLARYEKLQVAHAPGTPGTFSTPPRISDPDMHHCTCVTHVPWCMLGSLTGALLGSRWRGKRSGHSSRMRNPQFYVSGKRPMINPLKLPCSAVVLSYTLDHGYYYGTKSEIPNYFDHAKILF